MLRLCCSSSRNPNMNNKVTLHIILIGVAGTIYNEYTIKPLGASGRGVAGRMEVDTRRRRVRASRGMADNLPDPH
eukprot:1146976-Pelagomonas_calceolata.AAC.2